MIAHSQPIALPSSHQQHQQDYHMHDSQGSYPGSSEGTFNPASYTRHFLGSPISWRAGSWGVPGSRFPVGSPTAQLLSSIDLNDFRSGKTPSSVENDSIMNALNVFEREGELCRNYTCCGLQLNDLHALLEHFEEVHIVVIDPTSAQPQAHIQIPFNPTIHDTSSTQPQQQLHQPQHHQPYSTSFDPDDMELDIDLDNNSNSLPPPPPSSARSSVRSSPSSCAPSPPDTPISTPLSAYPSPHPFVSHHLPMQNHHSTSPYISAPSSPLASNYDPSTAASTRQNSPTLVNQHQHRPNLNLNLNVAHTGGFPRATPASTLLAHPEEAFNSYARFASDYSSSMPGAQFNGAAVDEASAVNSAGLTAWQQQVQAQQSQSGGCVPPALLFASTTSVNGARDESVSQPQSRVPSPGANGKKAVPALPSGMAKAHSTHPRLGAATAPPTPTSTSPSSALPSSAGASTSSTSSPAVPRPQPSLLLGKPFRCPKPNCNKSYKQANGLKYHMTHGSCNFAPPKDLEHVKDLLERKRREREASAGGTGLHRSASLGSVPGGSNLVAASSNVNNAAGGSVAEHAQTSPSTPTTPLSPTSILSLTYSDLSHIPEAELREVEREAERRLRPFACGVGECTRRYKNMNGLRYHYQHSGDHGAVGLALLASGQHECLGWGKRGGNSNNQGGKAAGTGGSSTTAAMGTSSGAAGTRIVGLGMGGSVSMPVSRAGSVGVSGSVASSRIGTPQPAPIASTSSPNAASASTFQQPTQQLQQQHLAQLQAMQAHMHQQQQQHLVAATLHQQQMQQQQQYGATQTTQTSTKTTAITPTPVVQAQAFVVPTVVSTGAHSRQGSAGSASSAGVQQRQQSSPHAQYNQVQQVPSPTQSQMHTSPQQQQAQVQVQSPQQQAQQAYAVAYSHYAQQMHRQYAQVQAQVQAQAQAQAAQQQQQVQQQAEMENQMVQDQSSNSPTSVVFNASGEYVGDGTSGGEPMSPQHQQQQQQYAQQVQMPVSSPTMGSPTHAHMMHQSPSMGAMMHGHGSPLQQQQQRQYDQQQQYHQYGMNGMDVSSLYAQQQHM